MDKIENTPHRTKIPPNGLIRAFLAAFSETFRRLCGF